MDNEVEIEVKIGNSNEVDSRLPRKKSGENAGESGRGFALHDFAYDISPGNKTNQEAKRRLENISRPAALGENGKTDEPDGQI